MPKRWNSRAALAAVERLGGTRIDPIGGLAGVRTVRALLDEKEQELVVAARQQERPWSEIGAALAITRQAAWERWHDLDPTEKEA